MMLLLVSDINVVRWITIRSSLPHHRHPVQAEKEKVMSPTLERLNEKVTHFCQNSISYLDVRSLALFSNPDGDGTKYSLL